MGIEILDDVHHAYEGTTRVSRLRDRARQLGLPKPLLSVLSGVLVTTERVGHFPENGQRSRAYCAAITPRSADEGLMPFATAHDSDCGPSRRGWAAAQSRSPCEQGGARQ